jgi:hypothetical protein
LLSIAVDVVRGGDSSSFGESSSSAAATLFLFVLLLLAMTLGFFGSDAIAKIRILDSYHWY